MNQGWIKSGHMQGDVLEPFSGSEMAIGGRHRAPKWPKKAINDPFVAISRPGSSKMVNQHVLEPFCGSRMAIMVQKGHNKTKQP